MRIGIIDADLLGRKKHRFPNLVCEKLSGYWKEKGADVDLIINYDNLDKYDKVYVAKVFTDTPIEYKLKKFIDVNKGNTQKLIIGGTGFFFDKAPNLPPEIEHHMPDYHLYDKWISKEIIRAKEVAESANKKFNEKYFMQQFKEYTDYSIGYLTRGCFRKCKFCVNQKYNHVFLGSKLKEFYDPGRKKICFLDDNFFGAGEKVWKRLLQEIKETGKPFKFKQGLDERLLTDDMCQMLFNEVTYDGDYTFAFDNIREYDLIHMQLKKIRRHTDNKNIKFYVLTGFDSTGVEDIENAFKRIDLLMQYQCLPYIMRYQDKDDAPWKHSVYRSMYVQLARWCNQPRFFKKMSFAEFCEANQKYAKTDKLCLSYRTMLNFKKQHPQIAKKYFYKKYEEYNL